MNDGGKFWTPKKDEQLRELCAQGKSASEMHEILGAVSRCAVLGRVFRLKIPHNGPRRRIKTQSTSTKIPHLPADGQIDKERRQVRERHKTFAMRHSYSGYALGAYGAKPTAGAAPILPSTYSGDFSGHGVSLLKARPSQCRWPYENRGPDGVPRCCGAKIVKGCSYCAEHARLAFTHIVSQKEEAA